MNFDEVPFDCYYEPVPTPPGHDDGYEYFQPTEATVSVWSPQIQHGGPPAGLLVRSMLGAVPDDGQEFTRVTFEIFGAMGLGVNRVRATMPRPGRRISMVSADLEIQEPGGDYRLAGRAVAWRMAASDTTSARTLPREPLPLGPDDLDQIIGFPDDPENGVPWGRVGFIGTTVVALTEGRNGRSQAVWIRPALPLVAGEEPTDLEQVFTVLDVANGVGTDLDPREWSWMNLDTTVHLVGRPTSGWLGIDADLAVGTRGYGASFADLYDVSGFLGRSAQTDLIAAQG
ncbi:thioesterase family protein [Gordonia shandongensis]|uniref:thioesterase family protein n=1 Tax=Gordonia shandongensis TaxID=376351 RepID=UPI0004136E2E|nr:thioesterase family protein [Gordonia shandongensis]